jgi:hypothetical protein
MRADEPEMNRMQTTDHVLMVRPVGFFSNPETAASNAFQRSDLVPAAAQAAALQEFDAYVDALRRAGVGALVLDDSPQPHTPDSIFPNNWVSFGADGRVFLFPMEAHNRRLERRVAVLAEVEKQFRIREIVDLSRFEAQSRFLEGTGSMVLDHEFKLAYVCHSSRSHPAVMQAFEGHSGYRTVWFHAVDRRGTPIYHTNVMMCVGRTLAVVCLQAIPDAGERDALCVSLRATGKRIVDISLAQVEDFAGNMIELRSQRGHPVFAMSRRAWSTLTPAQQQAIADYAEPVLAPIDTIERLGGGGARCMVAEIFLPRLNADPAAQADRHLASATDR